MSWKSSQNNVVLACFLGWTLDAFDFFLMVFVLKDIALEFDSHVAVVTLSLTLTLAMRPLGAFIFGRLADRFGRRPILMADIGLFSLFELLTAFSPNLITFMVLRALFGIAMGGEWGIGSALMMESLPTKSRGFASGLLQAGYPAGYLLASLIFALFYNTLGWRGMCIVGVIPALLVMFIRRHVPESEAWKAGKMKPKPHFLSSLAKNGKLTAYAVALMTAFNFFAHGSQDLYPTFLQVQHGFDVHTIGLIAIIYNVGAIIGGISIGILSEYMGRRYAILIAALAALPLIPLWAFASTPLLLATGAFFMQIAVQGAWGVIPAYLNELSPKEIRATFPGTVYQLGNFLASANATLQAFIAMQLGGNYSVALSVVVGVVAVIIAIMVFLGPERHGIDMQE